MGQTLLTNQLFLYLSTLRAHKSETVGGSWTIVCALPILALGLGIIALAGCQTSPPLSKTALPIPPEILSTDQLDNVRFQSPDHGQLSSAASKFSEKIRSFAPQQPTTSSKTAPLDRSQLVADVIFSGNRYLQTHQLTRNIRTRPGRYFDPDKLKQDVDQLWRMAEIRRIKGPYLKHTPDGVIVNIEVEERNAISKVEFIGNRGLSDRLLLKTAGISEGDPLDVHAIRLAKTRIEDLYKDKGFPRTQVELTEGTEAGDGKVVFLIHEDEKQRVWNVKFEGNAIASDARLKSFVKSKPGILKLIGGLAKRDELDQDITRLTTYYRSLGFFNAKIGREFEESNDGKWVTVRFIINEGPRYKVRNVKFVGNNAFQSEQLIQLLELRPGVESEMPDFKVSTMNQDVVSLRDLYGGQGFVFADVQAEPRFLEQPGLLDLVYKIDEGKQYRVGKVNIHYDGDYGITKREVVLNRLSVRPGDLIDVREIRRSESRLGSSQVFASRATPGAEPPRIVVRTPEQKTLEQHRGSGGSGTRSASAPPSGGSGSRGLRPSQGSSFR